MSPRSTEDRWRLHRRAGFDGTAGTSCRSRTRNWPTIFCQARLIMLSRDEVITGFGRTGKMFATELGLQTSQPSMALHEIGYLPIGGAIARKSIGVGPSSNEDIDVKHLITFRRQSPPGFRIGQPRSWKARAWSRIRRAWENLYERLRRCTSTASSRREEVWGAGRVGSSQGHQGEVPEGGEARRQASALSTRTTPGTRRESSQSLGPCAARDPDIFPSLDLDKKPDL